MFQPYSLHSFRKRILAICLAISFIFCALGVRLFVIQIINGGSLQVRATDQWTRDLAIAAPRGKVLDATGASLAVSYTTYNVFVRAREVMHPAETAHALAKHLNMSYETVYEKVRKKGVSETLIKMQLSAEAAEQIYDLQLPGVYLAENVGRFYPYGNLLTQVMGFTSIDNVGQSGIEAYYEKQLKGVDGYSYVQSDLQGKEIGGSLRYYYPATAGNDLKLTIDSKIQLSLEQVLEKVMLEQKPISATGLVLSAKTGALLAMSTKPSFDLNNVPRDDLDALFAQSKNKAVTDVYEPGSTFKILTVAAALEEGLTNLEDRFYCPGYRVIDGVRIKCWKTIGHGSQNLVEAFQNSCNCCFMDLALRLGVDKFYAYMHRFGLGQRTGVPISGEGKGILMEQSLVKRVDLARMGFGHAIALTPLQLAVAVASITNGGSLYKPHLVDEIFDSTGKTVSKTVPTCKSTVISQQTGNTVNLLLEKATNKLEPFTFVEGYNVGGKTGTAQKYQESGGIAQGKYISSFVGTYPANNPDYIVLLLVDEPSAGAYYGSIVAAPYGKEVFSGIFAYRALPKDSLDAQVEFVQMPDVVGWSLTDAALRLKELGLFFDLDGAGEFVMHQLPPPGTSIEKGSTIVLIA